MEGLAGVFTILISPLSTILSLRYRFYVRLLTPSFLP
ncbi:hypothetical protein E2C01_077949 [Portunus trituberculatus]|uniref:Uncharacterized protein n=1 Tax=Portunus trituberculatus TaxID=210409 RepID=A0A5B7IST8_PORTR|nr:hypothetical protein [Portunus trituberculatus]